MNASMVRFGGIALFIYLGLTVINALTLGNTVGGRIVSLIATALLIFGFWATKGFMNAKGHAKADVPILIIIGASALTAILGLFGLGGGLGGMGGMGAMGAGGIQAGIVIALVIMLIWFLAWLWFGFSSLGFGKTAGGVWKATGILYIIGMAGLALTILFVILGIVAKSGGLAVLGGILGLIGILVLLAAMIVHGIALIQGAGKM